MRLTSARWRKIADWPLTAAAVVFLVVYSWQILGELHGASLHVTNVVIWITWAMFVVDYVVSLVLAERRWRWFYRHLVDLAIVVLPVLRPLRLLRFITVIQFISRSAGTLLRGRIVLYTVLATAIVVYSASLTVYDLERDEPGSNIRSFGDAVWWAFETITTVGYGDQYPVSFAGRVVAVGLMVCGISLVGVVTATVASWVVERVSVETNREEAVTVEHINALTEEIARLRASIDAGPGRTPS